MDQQLLSPVTIGPVTIRNRVTFCAPSPAYAGVDDDANMPTAEIAASWEHLARGGLGLIVGEPQSVHRTSTPNPRTVENVTDAIVPRYRLVADAVHEHGARIFGQLWHAGFLGAPAYRNEPLWAPSAVRAPVGAQIPAGGGGIPYAMTARDIRALVAAFGAAARRLREAGFDGIEVNAAQGFLLAEFLSPAVNQREDEYGGSLENRSRFVVEVLRAVREAAGPRMAVGVRLGPDPFIEPGITAGDLPAIAECIAGQVALDYVNVVPALFMDPSYPQGAGVEITQAVRRAAGVHVIYNGQLTDPARAEAMVRDEGIDLAGMTRALLADPQFPNKIQEGREREIRRCASCNQTCTGGGGGMLAAATPHCLLNPMPAEVEVLARAHDGAGLRMLVIGAGLAGLEAARLGRLRGYAVTVWERSDRIGGQVNLAARVPQRSGFQGIIDYYAGQLDGWGVDLHLGVTATADAVQAFGADVVVIATGSRPALGHWPSHGHDGAANGQVTDVRSVLAGDAALGQRVVLAMAETDHGYQGLPVAEMLADQGHHVTIVTPAFEMGMHQDFATSEQAYRRMLRKGVRIIPGAEVTGVHDGEATTENAHTRKAGSLPADSVVVSGGGVADDGLFHELEARGVNVYSAGDCVAPRDMSGAIADALRLMMRIRPAAQVR